MIKDKAAYLRMRRVEAKKKGLCTHCFCKPVMPGRKTCETCHAYDVKRNERRKAERAASGGRHVMPKAPERKKPKESVDDVAVKARRAGMSYGKYLAWMSGQLKRQEGE